MIRHMLLRLMTIALLCAATGLMGCDDNAANKPAPPSGANGPQPRRIVSLAPSLTQIIVDLGLESEIVGVPQNDAAAPSGAAVVGHFQDIDYEKLATLKPTHVVMMASRAPDRLVQMADDLDFILAVYPFPESAFDIIFTIYKPVSDGQVQVYGPFTGETNCLGGALDALPQAAALAGRIGRELSAISSVTSQLDFKSQDQNVLMVIALDTTVMASGKDTFFDNALLSYVKASNAAMFSDVSAPTLSRERLATNRMAIDVILLILPGEPPLGDLENDTRLEVFRGLEIPAVKNKRIYLINDPLAKLPSSAIPRVIAQMAKSVHPKVAASIDRAFKHASINQVNGHSDAVDP